MVDGAPPTVSDLAKRIELLYGQGRYELALRDAALALALDPGAAGIHRQRAYCLSALKRHDEAIEAARQAIAYAPDVAMNHRALAWACFQHRLLMRAEIAADEAIRLDPGQPENWRMRALILARRKAWDASLKAAERGLAISPAYTSCALLRTQALLNLGDAAAAIDGARAILALHPEEDEAHALLGLALSRNNDRAGAEMHLREAIRLAPEKEWIRSAMRQVLLEHEFGYRLLVKLHLRSAQRDMPGSRAGRLQRLPWLRLFVVTLAVVLSSAATFRSQPLALVTASLIGIMVACLYAIRFLVAVVKWRAQRRVRRHAIGRYLEPPNER